VLDTLRDGRLLDQIYGYEPGWGYPSAQDREAITRIMAATDEEEAETEGPPETAETWPNSEEAAGDKGTA
jgi:hypothetical protein